MRVNSRVSQRRIFISAECKYSLIHVGGIKNTLFGGEGVFFATLRGPGEVWLQTLPISRLAFRILSYGSPGGRKEEGGLLGGIGNLIDGDGF